MPGAEILGCEIAAGRLAQIVVHIGRADAARNPIGIEMLEQHLPGQIDACAYQTRDRRVGHFDAVQDAALATKGQAQG